VTPQSNDFSSSLSYIDIGRYQNLIHIFDVCPGQFYDSYKLAKSLISLKHLSIL
jgi:hypothetical protein